MELNTKESGEMINNMEMVEKHGLMVLATKEITIKEKRMDLVNLSGQMVQNILESFLIMKLMEKGPIHGLTIEHLKVIGLII